MDRHRAWGSSPRPFTRPFGAISSAFTPLSVEAIRPTKVTSGSRQITVVPGATRSPGRPSSRPRAAPDRHRDRRPSARRERSPDPLQFLCARRPGECGSVVAHDALLRRPVQRRGTEMGSGRVCVPYWNRVNAAHGFKPVHESPADAIKESLEQRAGSVETTYPARSVPTAGHN